MRIGQDDDNFLSIEASPIEDDSHALRVEAVASALGRRFTGSHDGVLLASAPKEDIKRFAEFEEFRTTFINFGLTEDGWLRFERDARGYITVRYRICSYYSSTVMEGKVLVDGEFAGVFCREFAALLKAQA